MPVPVLFHPACQRHNAGPGHPERPERIVAVLEALRAADMAATVEWCEARPAPREADERGVGNVFNVPRPPGLPRQLYARDLLTAVDAALEGWPPDLLLVSAGFDSLNGDPLGGFTLEPEDIARWTALLRERVAPAPVVGVLEGGYRLDLLAAGARAHVRAIA